MSYQIAYEALMEIIPKREISRFKALLAGYKSLELVITQSQNGLITKVGIFLPLMLTIFIKGWHQTLLKNYPIKCLFMEIL